MAGTKSGGCGVITNKKNWADPRDIEFQAIGNGEFVITILQDKPCIIHIRREKKQPFFSIEAHKTEGYRIFPPTEK